MIKNIFKVGWKRKQRSSTSSNNPNGTQAWPFPLVPPWMLDLMHLHKPPKNLWKSAPVFEIIYFCWTHSKCRNNRPTHFCPITQKKPKWSFVLLQFEIRQEMEQKASALITVFGVVGVLLSPSWYRQKKKAWVKTTKCPKIIHYPTAFVTLLSAMDVSMIYILFFSYCSVVLNCIISP